MIRYGGPRGGSGIEEGRKVKNESAWASLIAILVIFGVLMGVMVGRIRQIGKDIAHVEEELRKHRVGVVEYMEEMSSRPTIHIERGTVYNADGEVVIENVEREP